jgi:hypothetical protein
LPSLQPYLGGELIWIIAQSQTVGLPESLRATEKGLPVEQPARTNAPHPANSNLKHIPDRFIIDSLFPLLSRIPELTYG